MKTIFHAKLIHLVSDKSLSTTISHKNNILIIGKILLDKYVRCDGKG